eukprot:3937245-Prymnesium_polylepis.2
MRQPSALRRPGGARCVCRACGGRGRRRRGRGGQRGSWVGTRIAHLRGGATTFYLPRIDLSPRHIASCRARGTPRSQDRVAPSTALWRIT